ncbi:hypothetical protein TNCV_2063801 [Trichonephila clavipes]|nr:hypothetical protein TNCV_2063801 [Trichonephila clavipes]
MATLITRFHKVGFFPMGKSQVIDVSRHSDQTRGFSCSSACCLYFGGHQALRCGHSSIPRPAQACLDVHSEYFEHLPFEIFANTAVDVSNTVVTALSASFN